MIFKYLLFIILNVTNRLTYFKVKYLNDIIQLCIINVKNATIGLIFRGNYVRSVRLNINNAPIVWILSRAYEDISVKHVNMQV